MLTYYAARINLLSLTKSTSLDEALKKAHKEIIALKGNPNLYSLSCYLTLEDGQVNLAKIVEQGEKEEIKKGKQDFINTLSLARDEFAQTSADKKVIDKIIKRVK